MIAAHVRGMHGTWGHMQATCISGLFSSTLPKEDTEALPNLPCDSLVEVITNLAILQCYLVASTLAGWNIMLCFSIIPIAKQTIHFLLAIAQHFRTTFSSEKQRFPPTYPPFFSDLMRPHYSNRGPWWGGVLEK